MRSAGTDRRSGVHVAGEDSCAMWTALQVMLPGAFTQVQFDVHWTGVVAAAHSTVDSWPPTVAVSDSDVV